MKTASWLPRFISKPTSKAMPIELGNIRVASPCPASWEKMAGDERVRHCQECKLNVYNLSEMTRIEAERLIANREGRTCVRFYRRADGTILTRDCPRGLQAVVRRLSRLAGAALSAMMSVGTAFAQASPQTCPQSKIDQAAQKAAGLALTVVDAQGAAISGAKIKATKKDKKQRVSVVTDGNGAALVSGMSPGPVLLTIEHQGFKTYTREIVVQQGQAQPLRVLLTVRDEVVIVGEVVETSLIDHHSATVQTTFSGDLIRQLPLR